MSPGLPILTYHAIDTNRSVIATDPTWFAETLAALHESGFQTVDLEEWIAQGRPDAERRFALTFDDGLRSILEVADLVARYHFQATVFLATGRMGGDNGWHGQRVGIPKHQVLKWSDLPELAAAGFRFAAHTRTHRRLDRCDEAALEAELRGSRDDLEQHLSRACRLLAYPYGAAPGRIQSAAARFFDAAFGTRLDYATIKDSNFNISRIDSFYLRSPMALKRLVTGQWRARLRARRALRRAREAGAVLLGD